MISALMKIKQDDVSKQGLAISGLCLFFFLVVVVFNAWELRMVIMFFNVWGGKIKRLKLVTCENDRKSEFRSRNRVLLEHSHSGLFVSCLRAVT